MGEASKEITEVAELDLSSYRTEEITEEVKELLDVASAVRTALITILFCILFFDFVWPWVFPQLRDGIWTYFWLAWGSVSGVLASIFLAPVRVLRKIADGLITILGLVVGLVEQAVLDLGRVKGGEVHLPSARSLVQQGVSDILLPIIEDVVEVAGGRFFGKPLAWIYRLSVKRIVRWVLKRIPWDAGSTREEDLAREETFRKTLGEVAEEAPSTVIWLEKFQEVLKSLRSRGLRWIEAPGYILSILVAAVSLGLFLMVHWIL